jgi:hypothetical protein
MIGQTQDANNFSECFGGLQEAPATAGSQRSIYGDVVLKAFYTVFEMGVNGKASRMGVAPQA